MAPAEFHSFAKLRAQIHNAVLAYHGVFQADCHRENCRTADCYSPRTEFESGLPQAWTASRVCIRPEGGGWQSAARSRADCQAVILIVAIRGVRARRLAIEWNPAPAILHREAPCLKRRIFLMRDFTSLKLIRGVLFRPKIYIIGLSWHTISWYYPFNRVIDLQCILTHTVQNINEALYGGTFMPKWPLLHDIIFFSLRNENQILSFYMYSPIMYA
jgi:hypothetical protein